MFLDTGLLVIRLVVGLVIAAHGAQKVFGWFGGGGMEGTVKMTRNLGLQPVEFWAAVSSLDELVGGLLTALGLLMPVGPLMIVANMLVAGYLVHGSKGFWNGKGGYEFPLVLGATAFGLALTGAGLYALDTLLPYHLPEPQVLIVGSIVVLLGFMAVIILWHRAHPPARQHATRGR